MAQMTEMERAPGQPFTFAGVARYASARFGRLLAVAFLFALLPAVAIGRLAGHCWWPVLTEAAGNLPEAATIQRGALQLKEPRLLAANHFLSLQLSLGEAARENAPVDLALDFGRYELIITSVLGENAFPYPDTWNITLDHKVIWPLWGAWKGPILLTVAASALILLILSWFTLALFYAPIVLTVAGLARRRINFLRAWKMSVAAQWPASLLMTFALALYSTGEIALLFVVIMFFAHFIPTLFNLLIPPFFLPRTQLVDAAAAEDEEEAPEPVATRRVERLKPARNRPEKSKPAGKANRANPFANSAGPKTRGRNPFQADGDE